MEPLSNPPASIPDVQSDLDSASQSIGLGGLLLIAFGSLLAIPGVFIELLTGGQGFLGSVVAGPLVEEIFKPMGLIILLTRRPNLKLSVPMGAMAGALSGLAFAAIENLLYLEIYIPNHDWRLTVWRWSVCVGVHVVCSTLVGYGLACNSCGKREKDRKEYQLLHSASPHLLDEPRERSGVYQGISLKFLVIATVLHGTYNFAVIVLQLGRWTVE